MNFAEPRLCLTQSDGGAIFTIYYKLGLQKPRAFPVSTCTRRTRMLFLARPAEEQPTEIRRRPKTGGNPLLPDVKLAPRASAKFLYQGRDKFLVRGVTYGTFAPNEHGGYPDPAQVRRDFIKMRECGVNTVRIYTEP